MVLCFALNPFSFSIFCFLADEHFLWLSTGRVGLAPPTYRWAKAHPYVRMSRIPAISFQAMSGYLSFTCLGIFLTGLAHNFNSSND